jgi:hypothetical protein
MVVDYYCTKCSATVGYDSTEHLWGCECFATRAVEEDGSMALEFIPDFWVNTEGKIALSLADKVALITDLTSPDNSPFLNALIRQIIHRAVTLADVHYGLSASTQALKAANQKVVERMEGGGSMEPA